MSIHLWATGKGTVSCHSFLIIGVVASTFGSDWFDTCLIEMYKTFAAQCKFVEPGLLKHMEYLRNSIVELCSLDVHKSSGKAQVSIKHLAMILQLALRTKKKVCDTNPKFLCCREGVDKETCIYGFHSFKELN